MITQSQKLCRFCMYFRNPTHLSIPFVYLASFPITSTKPIPRNWRGGCYIFFLYCMKCEMSGSICQSDHAWGLEFKATSVVKNKKEAGDWNSAGIWIIPDFPQGAMLNFFLSFFFFIPAMLLNGPLGAIIFIPSKSNTILYFNLYFMNKILSIFLTNTCPNHVFWLHSLFRTFL